MLYTSLIAVFTILNTANALAADPICVKTALSTVIQGMTWEQILDPDLTDNLDHYTYLVHALPSEAHLKRILELEQGSGMNVSNAIDLVKNPELIASKQKLSTSIITEASHQTFESRGFGFIIKAKKSNIVATVNRDMGSAVTVAPGEIEKFYADMAARHPVQSPAELTADPKKMNEVLLRGTSADGDEISIAGIWAFTDAKGNLNLKPSELEDLMSLQKKLGLPIRHLNEGDSRMRIMFDSN